MIWGEESNQEEWVFFNNPDTYSSKSESNEDNINGMGNLRC